MPDRHSRATMRQVQRAYDAMPEPARAVFDRHRFDGMPYGEIAEALGTTVPEVEQRMAEAMRHLMDESDPPGPGASARFGAWLRAAFGRVWQR